MALSITITFSNNKKICVPYKSTITIKELIQSICKRSNLPNDTYTLEINGAELYEDDNLEELGINDNMELLLKSSNNLMSNINIPENNTTIAETNSGNAGVSITTFQNSTSNINNNNNSSVNNNEIKNQNGNVTINCIDMIVLDLSGSMRLSAFKGSKVPGELEMTRIEFAQAIFQTFIDKMVSYELSAACGLVCFGSSAQLTFGITRNFDSFSNELGEIQANMGNTHLWEAIILAAKTIVDFRNNPNIKLAAPEKLLCRVFCLSDGEDNSNSSTMLDAYDYLKKNNVVLDCIPIGLEGRSRLSALSTATGGSCFIADSSQEGVELFEREALLSLALRDNFKPFSISVSNITELESLGGDFKKTIERKVDAKFSPSIICKSTVDTAAIESSGMSKSYSGKRVFKEYQELKEEIKNDKNSPYTVFLSENDLTAWKVIIRGPSNSPYEQGLFVLSVTFPDEYPFKPMTVRFITKVYHCNINNDGYICLDVLKDCWTPSLTISKILLSISSLLTTPNPDDPLDVVKAGVYRDNKETFNTNAREWVRNYAGFTIADLKKIHGLE
ncbi:hypothetical protein DICPUDRAFT_94383 [Dictyostelium purpureum]|uniref:UBC core domain-containing protein n=1 Tax=Dictyostelium purpureum TaxID=5786 RepID=F0ZIV7_DICPU|nr:uncharacterized protein DICPUDRAFT_94383 [Dictyostelium purpureum]EGC36092.1 hypothetical protein DICPUDRAFT_94383 [Dictyostelium purpureum]|eukprot:XP_003287349.1 hypothetical protein DICPUDRAFT_94383 [Dictyostelium purpureum]